MIPIITSTTIINAGLNILHILIPRPWIIL